MFKIWQKIKNITLLYAETAPVSGEEKTRLLHYTIFLLLGLPAMLIFGSINLMAGNFRLSLIIFLSFIGLVAGRIGLQFLTNFRIIYRINSFLFGFLILNLLIIGGDEGSKILWMYIFPLCAFFLFGKYEGFFWSACMLFFAMALLWVPLEFISVYPYSHSVKVRFTITYLMISTITYWFEYFRFSYRREIEEKNENLKREITERLKIEKALRQSEKQYRALFRQASDGILIFNDYGIISNANKRILTLLGYELEELRGRNVIDLVHPEDLKKVPSQLPRLLIGEALIIERRLIKKNGDYVVVEASVKRALKNIIFSLYRDITERKRAETEREKLITDLQTALNEIKTLSGLLPLCSSCHKIRDDKGYWNLLEAYIQDHSDVKFSHGICPDCKRKLYPDY